jgi:fructose/tagatose bisphosphate aldolase
MAELEDVLAATGNSIVLEGRAARIKDEDGFRSHIGKLVEISGLGSGAKQGWARYLVRRAALEQDIVPSSIDALYRARGGGQVPLTFTAPALNLRVSSFDAARAVFRVARRMNAAAFIFEIARSEIGYTDQRPAEYATNILAAAIAEKWRGPVFLQGDHFQVSAKKYAADAPAETKAVKDLTAEAIGAGFYNIDIDTSTLVDVSKHDVKEQQKTNFDLSSELAAFVRQTEPATVTVSIGGEIGEVGGHNSNAQELRAFMDGFNAALKARAPGKTGLSKISIQTGTSHGGTVLPNGKLARVNIDFDTLKALSQLARSEYQLGGTVQHGASTLQEDAFHRFVENEAVEVHLATNFMTIFYDNAPDDLRRSMYAWLDENAAAERKPGMTDEQFYYKTRKNAIGAFKRQIFGMDAAQHEKVSAAWEAQFAKLFELLGMQDTRQYVEKFIHPVQVAPAAEYYLGSGPAAAGADDLQD